MLSHIFRAVCAAFETVPPFGIISLPLVSTGDGAPLRYYLPPLGICRFPTAAC